MKSYELALHLSPELEEKETSEFVLRLKNFIQKEKGEIKKETPLLKINLSSPIKKESGSYFENSYFLSLEINLDKENLPKLRNDLDRQAQILRYLLVKAPAPRKIITRRKRKPIKDKKIEEISKPAPKKEPTKESLLKEKTPVKEKKKKPPKQKKIKLEDIDKSIEKILEQEL